MGSCEESLSEICRAAFWTLLCSIMLMRERRLSAEYALTKVCRVFLCFFLSFLYKQFSDSDCREECSRGISCSKNVIKRGWHMFFKMQKPGMWIRIRCIADPVPGSASASVRSRSRDLNADLDPGSLPYADSDSHHWLKPKTINLSSLNILFM